MTGKEDLSPEQPRSLASTANGTEAGPSELPPPSFHESRGDAVVEFDQVTNAFPEGGEEPPQFAPYEAEHWVSGSDKIISHDPHLNEDGEALYRFLLSQAETPPTFFIRCRGTHTERRTRLVTRTDAQGRHHTEIEHYTVTITDFDFTFRQLVPRGATQWTVGDEEPAYRGRMSREVGLPGDTTKADRPTENRFKAWRVTRERRGMPPWVGPSDAALFRTSAVQPPYSMNVLKSSWTLRQWADDYCQSRNIFKEFVYEKIIYGWDLATLESAIRAAIQSTGYNNHIEVSFKSGHKTVIVRPDTTISRAISNPYLKFILIITLIYPCIWLFKRFYWRGGGRWRVGGSAYAMRRVVGRSERVEGGRTVIGETEGEWMWRWENSIRRSVIDRRVD